jgi:integrase/recombinase XerD
MRMVPVRRYFRWLARQNVLLWNPASELELPRPEHRLPKHVLTANEAERALAVPDITDILGLRDRAILEVFYATGIRRSELINLHVEDIDVERATVMVRLGKGKKDRLVPLGERALAWVLKYLEIARPELVAVEDAGVLFLTQLGQPASPQWMSEKVAKLLDASGVGKKGSCHLFRHTMATLMLEGGADVRYVQEMLGHAKLETTKIYTRVSIQALREVHAATHPGAKLERGPALKKTRPDDDPEAERELFSSLAAEAALEDDDIAGAS